MAKLLWTCKRRFGPSARMSHAMAFDSRRARSVLFGGLAPDTATHLDDTWIWQGESWTQTNDIGPAPRSEAAMAYDETRDRVVLFGGYDGNATFNDTWEWNGEDWTQTAESGPSARRGHSMVFDNRRKRMLLFGGEASGVALDDTWEWNGEEWVQVEDSGPSPRSYHAMAFDRKRARAVLFGGIVRGESLGDTWEWEGSAWTKVADFGPAPAHMGAMMFDGRHALYFGGTNSEKAYGLTWEWDGKHWTIRQDFGPSPRLGHAMVFDTARSRGVLFGGAATRTEQSVASSDTYEQFEEGLHAPDNSGTLGEILAEPLAVLPSQPREGQQLDIAIRFKQAAPAGTQLEFALKHEPSNGSIAVFRVDVGGLLELTFPFFLASGDYVATITIAGASAPLAFTVNPGNAILVALLAAPAEAPPETSLTLTATLHDPAPAGGVTVPLRFIIGNNPEYVLSGPAQLRISAGQTNGAVTLSWEIFKYFPRPTQALFFGSLGGNRVSALVMLI